MIMRRYSRARSSPTRTVSTTPGVIDANDTEAFGRNIADIASGKIKVRIPGRA